MLEVVVGIDTSNYTTSFAIISRDGELIANLKRPLPVKEGERGLRQSDAVFAHVKNIPDIMQEASEYLKDSKIVAVGVSERPRNVDGSYMPCFLAGVAQAESICATQSVPLYRYSHQCGHVMAAIFSSGNLDLLNKDFLAYHVSGGTTEMLKVKYNGISFDSELIGGTADLNAGQLIDRIGVHMGLRFPCGKEMEMLALDTSNKVMAKKPKVTDFKVNLSGIENQAVKLYSECGDKAAVSSFVFDSVGKSLVALTDSYFEKFGECDLLFAGGVMSNGIIKKMISDKYSASFAAPSLSADNAVGVAYLAYRRYISENK